MKYGKVGNCIKNNKKDIKKKIQDKSTPNKLEPIKNHIIEVKDRRVTFIKHKKTIK